MYAAIDAPGGFLFEWWSVFWDIFIARTNEKHSEAAASYIEVAPLMKAFINVTTNYVAAHVDTLFPSLSLLFPCYDFVV